MKRKEFIEKSALLMVGLFVLPGFVSCKKKMMLSQLIGQDTVTLNQYPKMGGVDFERYILSADAFDAEGMEAIQAQVIAVQRIVEGFRMQIEGISAYADVQHNLTQKFGKPLKTYRNSFGEGTVWTAGGLVYEASVNADKFDIKPLTFYSVSKAGSKGIYF